MKQQNLLPSTFVLERSYPAPPDRVFAAFADPTKRIRWSFEGEHHKLEHCEMDFRTGGLERVDMRMGPNTPIANMLITRDARYQYIENDRCIIMASTMSLEGRIMSASLETFELLPTETGTDLIFTHHAMFFEHSDGPEMRKGGWSRMLDELSSQL